MVQPFRVIRGLGGNGGTFLCRAIAAMQNVVLLSETNPLTANLFRYALNPAVQIERNYRDKGIPKYGGHIAELGAPPLFGEYLSALRDACEEKGLHLVIRDYNYVDYVGSPFVWSLPRHSSLNAALQGKIREIVLIRHPVPQFLSLRSHLELARALDYRVFLEGYRRMLEMHEAGLWLKYEVVFSDFNRLINEIADEFEIPLDEGWSARLPQITWITGSQTAKNKQKPEPPANIWPHADPRLRELFLAEETYRKICELCGYEP